MAVEFKVGVVKTEGYKGLDCGSRYVGWKEMGYVLELEYGGREGFFHVTRGVEGFDVQGSVTGEVGVFSSIEVLFEVWGFAALKSLIESLFSRQKRSPRDYARICQLFL